MYLRVGAETHSGQRREINQDAHLILPGLYLVADGMGGHQAGEVASQLAVELIAQRPLPQDLDLQALQSLIWEVNSLIYQEGQRPEYQGMGTTLTMLWVQGEEYALAQVGDSRAYRLRGGILTQLTEDHTLVNEMVKKGALSPADARVHPQRNLVTRALGSSPQVEVDLSQGVLESGDVFLLCSDGLSGLLTDEDLTRFLERDETPQDVAQALVREANDRGGPDNITAIIVHISQTLESRRDSGG